MGTLGALIVSAGVAFGLAGCASAGRMDRLERRLGAIEQRLERLTAAGPASVSTPTRSAATLSETPDVEIARLRADIDDIRLLLLDLQMKAGR